MSATIAAPDSRSDLQTAAPLAAHGRLLLAFCLIIAFAVGAWLRLDQILAQVLLDDEWHLVHEITYYHPAQIASSFGGADYSIPLALLDWAEMQRLPVSELSLRLPMIVAGLLTLALLPLGLRGRMGGRVIALFALLLALSPFLISYSRIARPYALTLLLTYVAFWLFERAMLGPAFRGWPALGYAVLCGIVVWAHAITGPMLVAPMLACAWTIWRGGRTGWRHLIATAMLAALAMGLAVLPPLLNDPGALAGKSGIDRVTWDTLYAASFLWFGTDSRVVLYGCVVTAALGFGSVWRAVPIARWAALGVVLTTLALLVARPWWVDKPLAFGRYLLPVVPLLLLAASAGVVRIADALHRATRSKRAGAAWTLAVAVPVLAALWLTSPLREIIAQPNSYAEHSYFQYDYRKGYNSARLGTGGISNSPFWKTLSAAEPGSLTVAVAPFRYASFEWPAPIWERESRQRVIPAYLWGTCTQGRHGEVPENARFALRNAVHLRDRSTLVAHGVDYLAYFRPVTLPGMSSPLPECEAWVREHYGPPDYEDDALVVWRIRAGS